MPLRMTDFPEIIDSLGLDRDPAGQWLALALLAGAAVLCMKLRRDARRRRSDAIARERDRARYDGT